MDSVATTFFFYLLSGFAILGGILVITRRKAAHAALALILTLLSLAGLYLMLYAPFVAAVQVILYAGGMMVMFLFVIMLVNRTHAQKERKFNQQWIAGGLAALALGGLFVMIYARGSALFPAHAVKLAEEPNTQQVGGLLYGSYMFSFEIASLLLLAAIIGAVVMAKKKV